ncbi:MAG: nuclear transport factor 2 family protein, partial [Parvularculaceae bacterium]
TNASALQGVRAPRPAAGRFVGAAADAKPLDSLTDEEIAEERLGAAPSTPAAPVAPAAAPVTTAAAAPKARAAEDIIKSVLAAQTAAWNEGDLEAFMGVYWKDPALRFVSGSTVSKGWKETMNRYRDRYGEGAAMGRLTLDAIDVDLVSDNVATVVGRYRVDNAKGTDAGLFTLVMKRFDGLWRIVHDHSTSETPNTN